MLLKTRATLKDEIIEAQVTDPQLEKIHRDVQVGKSLGFVVQEDGALRFQGRLCVCSVNDLKRRIMEEAHTTPYSIHPGGNKMYKDLLQIY